MEVRVLGPVEVVHDDGSVTAPPGAAARTVLCVLAASHPHAVPVTALVDALWPDDPPPSARHTVHAHVSRLRTRTRVPVLAVDGAYRLDLPPEACDRVRFEQAALTADGDAEHLRAALDLWRGAPFATSTDGVREVATRLLELRAVATERLVDALVGAGRAPEGVVIGEGLTAEHATRESAWASLIAALVAAGRPADAVAAYSRATAALDELGLLPSAGLRAAQAAAYAAADPRHAEVAPRPARPLRGAPAVLPGPVTTLVGRDRDVAVLPSLLAPGALVTLVGPGGVGKTRLALELARLHGVGRQAGVRVVELSTVEDPSAVPGAALAALGVTAHGGPPGAALRWAAGLDALLVLDSCEHVLDAVAELVPHLVGGHLTVLATSRERLGTAAERVHRVEPLATTGDDPPARRLFRQRAAAAGALEDLGRTDPDVIDRLVAALDGLPLAIEMAAARAATVGIDDLARLLSGDGAGAPAGAAGLRHPDRAAPARHRSLDDVIAWSEALLPEPERTALLAWPVFAGPVTADDARAVLGTEPQVVERLTAQSLLWAQVDGRTRYRMPRTVRAALLSRPGLPPLRRREHLEHLSAVAAACDADLRGRGEPGAVDRLSSLVPELRAAHAFARGHDPSAAARLSRDLHVFATSTLDEEVLSWAALLAGLPDAGPEVAAVGELGIAARLVLADRPAAAAERARRALERTADPVVARLALELLTDAALYDGRLAECRQAAVRLADLAQRDADPYHLVMARSSAALAAAYEGDRAAALAVVERTQTELGPPAELSPTVAGWLAFVRGEVVLDDAPDEAAAHLDRAVALADAAGNRYLGGVARVSTATLRSRQGDPGAFEGIAQVVRWWLDRGDVAHLVTTLRNLVDLLVRTGADEQAAQLWGAVSHEAGARSFGAERARLDEAGTALRHRLGADRFTALAATGRGRDLATVARSLLADPPRP